VSDLGSIAAKTRPLHDVAATNNAVRTITRGLRIARGATPAAHDRYGRLHAEARPAGRHRVPRPGLCRERRDRGGRPMTVLALSSNQSAWVYTLVVSALLEGLRRTVNAFERKLWATWVSGKHVVAHTATTYLLKNTRTSGAQLVEELAHHGS
jgi:hypothetical protein